MIVNQHITPQLGESLSDMFKHSNLLFKQYHGLTISEQIGFDELDFIDDVLSMYIKSINR